VYGYLIFFLKGIFMKKLLFLTLFFASPFVLADDDDGYATCNPSYALIAKLSRLYFL